MKSLALHYITHSVFGLISIATHIAGRPFKVRRSDVHVLHEMPSKEAETSSEPEGDESVENAAASACTHMYI